MPKRLAQISKSKLQSAMLAGRDHEERDRTGSAIPGTGFSVSENQVLIKNSTGSDLLRGSILEIGDNQLTKISRGRLMYDGSQPSGSEIDFAILNEPARNGKYVPGQVAGVAVARVNVTDTGHTHAEPSSGEDLLQSSSSGPVKILGSLSSTGEQDLGVLFVPATSVRRRYLCKPSIPQSYTDGDEIVLQESTFPSAPGNSLGFSLIDSPDGNGKAVQIENAGVYSVRFSGEIIPTSLTLTTMLPTWLWMVNMFYDDPVGGPATIEFTRESIDGYRELATPFDVSGPHPSSSKYRKIAMATHVNAAEDSSIYLNFNDGGGFSISTAVNITGALSIIQID